MDSQWQSYKDPLVGRPAPFTNNGLTSNPNPQQLPSNYGGQPQPSQPPAGYTYETFQTPGVAAKPSSVATNSKSASMASSPTATPHTRDYVTDADTAMEDADPYNRAKYPTRTNHQSRPSSQYFPTEGSSAARRYSPMNVLSPTLPFNSSPGKSSNSYGFPPATHQSRQSPTRTANYSSPSQAHQSPPCKSFPRKYSPPLLTWLTVNLR
jgi:dual specificity protein kinase YAK1